MLYSTISRCLVLGMLLLCSTYLHAQSQEKKSLSEITADMQAFDGYFDFYWDEEEGKIWLVVDKLDTEFLYVNSLSAGVGSNDIGLDRSQLGDTRILKFMRSGPKLLLIQPNYDYRAVSDNPAEQASVAEAFAQSVLHGFSIKSEETGKLLIDFTPFLIRDAHGVIGALQRSGQGSYQLDASRSAIYLPRCDAFPKNSEFEALLTFKGQPKGGYVRSVVPTPTAISVRMHHSLVELPDDKYKPRKFDPRSGYFGISYQDYATPIGEPLMKRFINRHRLEKKNPKAKVSEAVEPIIYYLDPGAPEPVKSALLEGAAWWNQAFEAAGFKDAFQVKVLPEGANPMDVRYNVIQWVHRSTRGWSYGTTVSDPRTGEIIKGHVLLGSLRVRQDFLIAEGLLAPYEEGRKPDPRMLEMALARLRQLSAHEVGHTIGLAHNFAASTNDRASVMDYPHPYISLNGDKLDFSNSYDTGIGEWDKYTVRYGYTDFPDGTDEDQALDDIMAEYIDEGLHYISDQDARPMGGSHAKAHLWDNGADPTTELGRVLKVRAHALERFGEDNIPEGRPVASLAEVLVPLYFAHRYQVEATAKLLAGVGFRYALRGDGQEGPTMIDANLQRKAFTGLLETLQPAQLALPPELLELIPPHPIGYYATRESFKVNNALGLDPISAAASAANHTLSLLLHPHRASRLVEFHARNQDMPGLSEVLSDLVESTWGQRYNSSYQAEVHRAVNYEVLRHIMQLAKDSRSNMQAQALALHQLNQLESWLDRECNSAVDQKTELAPGYFAQYSMALLSIRRFKEDPEDLDLPPARSLPDGSPIGMGCMHGAH